MLKLYRAIAITRERITAHGLLASLAFAGLTAVCSQIAFHLPWTPVPVTLQTFAVLLSGLMLGKKLGAMSQVQYLALGLMGAPVFAGFTGGPAALLGPSGGYLPGFVIGAYVAGLMWEKSRSRSFAEAVVAGISGIVCVYFTGTLWLLVYLQFFQGQSTAWLPWMYGVAPFIGVDAVKAVAAAHIVSRRASASDHSKAPWQR